jgi:hypothetical protein
MPEEIPSVEELRANPVPVCIGPYEGAEIWLIPHANKVAVVSRKTGQSDHIYSEHYQPQAWYNALTCAMAMREDQKLLKTCQAMQAAREASPSDLTHKLCATCLKPVPVTSKTGLCRECQDNPIKPGTYVEPQWINPTQVRPRIIQDLWCEDATPPSEPES